ncbi:TNFAIP3-interacting protein 3 [Sphaerodactylus townsendi]|uniref:TNFAIP3-interacting protein 3 n=1 Tax=Sphaerodactylus townsendi TaxID=933632 RepID=UPI00202647F5|nr:TNFAIP3-interacting protein 3 [Sphaerodactylus townsendi]
MAAANDYWKIKISEEVSQKLLDMSISQQTDSERCDSVELDNGIRTLIGKSCATEKLEFSSCTLKAFGKSEIQVNSAQMQAGMDETKTSVGVPEHLLTKKNVSAYMLEMQIISLEKQRKELLTVNNRWDQQFRQMKQCYEKKVTELKTILETMQNRVRELEKERHKMQKECQRLEALARDQHLQEMRDKNTLKEENRLLKKETALANTKKMHYEGEINRLNKALLDALNNHKVSSHAPNVYELNRNCTQDEMRMQIEVLRQQVQIYEEDFKKERSDREKLNEEKEALQRVNKRAQSQLKKLNSQLKDFQEEKEFLEKQVKQQAREVQALPEQQGFPHQMFGPPCLSCRNCGLFHPYSESWITLVPCGINRTAQSPAILPVITSTSQS